MGKRPFTISLSLGWNERFDHRIAIGIIKESRASEDGREDIRLYGNDWLFQSSGPGKARPDGIIARILGREDLRRLRAFGVPIVDIANAYDTDMPKVMNDDSLTGRMAALHLLDKGYAHLAYVGLDDANWSAERLAGVREVLGERDMPEGLPVFQAGSAWQSRGHNLSGLVRWLRKLPFPCGVMAANDLLGYRVTLAADMAGLRVPGDVGVVGVDNEDMYCELAQPELTSIACDCERIGMEAVGLLRQILGGEDPLRRVVVPPLGVVVRASSSHLADADKIIRDVRMYIRANVGRGINVADVAGAFPLSRRALEKRFRQGAGATLHEEIMDARLKMAEELLLSGAGAAEAGFASGFRTTPHFYHAFRARYGMTPLEYVGRKGLG